MQPLMNMITFTARSRAEIIDLHRAIVAGLEIRDVASVDRALAKLEAYTITLGQSVLKARATR
jgi:hypothetical protein